MSERVPNAQTSFTPSFNTACFTLLAESPVQDVFVNGIDLAGVLMLDAFTLSSRGSIWMVDEDVIRDNQKKGYCSSGRVSDRHLMLPSACALSNQVVTRLHQCRKCQGQTLARLADHLHRI